MELNVDSLGKYPMGPTIEAWLKISSKGKKLNFEQLTNKHHDLFSKGVLTRAEQHPIESTDTLVNIFDELLAMNLPLLVLQVADKHSDIWLRDDFRGVLIEGLAAMFAGELSRAELCFIEAQSIMPSEPAPYVNIIKIMQHDLRWEESWTWCQAALEAVPNSLKLWELVLSYFQTKNKEQLVQSILTLAKQHNSWAGFSLCADIDELSNQTTKAQYLSSFFTEGERSSEFLIEYTGALGAAGDFDKIPTIIWQAEKESSQKLPWKLRLHAAQAQLAMDHKPEFLKAAKEILNDQSIPENLSKELATLYKEIEGEIEAESKTENPK